MYAIRSYYVLHEVHQSTFSDGRVEVSHLDEVAWPSLLTPDLLGIVVLKPKNMSARDIGQLVEYLDESYNFV